MSVLREVVEVVKEVGSEDRPVRSDQRKRLAELQNATGTSYAYPHTEAEADVEIAKMEGRPVSSGIEEWMDRVPVRSKVARGARDAASVRGSEIEDYGSRCRWRYAQR